MSLSRVSLTVLTRHVRVPDVLRDQIESVRQRIARSCARSGREPSSVTLVAVTQGVPVGRLRDAVALGLTELGENRVQEAQAKQKALSEFRIADCGFRNERLPKSEIPNPKSESVPVRWHLI